MPQHARVTDDDKDAIILRPKTVSFMAFIISTGAILISIGVSFGITHSEISNLRESKVQAAQQMQNLEKELHDHEKDGDVHMDKTFKNDLLTQMSEIRNYLLQNKPIPPAPFRRSQP